MNNLPANHTDFLLYTSTTGEFNEGSVVGEFLATAEDGKQYNTELSWTNYLKAILPKK